MFYVTKYFLLITCTNTFVFNLVMIYFSEKNKYDVFV